MCSLRRQSLPNLLAIQPVCYVKQEQKRITQVNQYLLLKKIGFGASSKIYLSQDTVSGKYYAIKVFKSVGILGEENAFDHFEREVTNLWNIVADNQKDISYEFEIISYNENTCIVNWQMTRTMTKSETKQEIDGIFQVSINDEGKCTYFKQWRFTRESK